MLLDVGLGLVMSEVFSRLRICVGLIHFGVVMTCCFVVVFTRGFFFSLEIQRVAKISVNFCEVECSFLDDCRTVTSNDGPLRHPIYNFPPLLLRRRSHFYTGGR